MRPIPSPSRLLGRIRRHDGMGKPWPRKSGPAEMLLNDPRRALDMDKSKSRAALGNVKGDPSHSTAAGMVIVISAANEAYS
ncbi:uncharacterized protein MYCFIDRAFT_173271 [Pseudocercospora fijiensis CIRAD86]|uniref:Uncharacterized protein n=1 Tax=Pseudocercospora fijiensis (strain CIRAD86) TaxID=383855 RepID=M3B4I1_PSEFD|nr:uncharacterized protein MYCFIDRAFT_173271 [Pseudocercospora fijiensis CIRAD86]EME84242.1 hypothetical protein MYCFIDRAFT_173271 [Pseudocercospora fijiensis CIRAD86]